MSKFCHNCGNQINDIDVFCEHCGTKQVMQEISRPEVSQPKPERNYVELLKKNPKIAWICGGAIVTILLIVILAVALSGSPYKSTLDNYFAVAVNGEYEKIEELAPEVFWEYLGESYYGMSAEEVVEYYEDSCDDYFGDGLLEEWEEEFGRNVKFSYKIVYENKLSERKLDNLQDALKDNYGIKRKDVKLAYEVELEAIISGSKDEDMEEVDLIVVNIDNEWYVVSSTGTISVYWDI